MNGDIHKRMRDALAAAAGQYGPITDVERNEWLALVQEYDTHPGREMNDREAMLALAEPEPEPFRQVRPSPDDNKAWQAWNDRRLAALAYARGES